MNQLATSRLQEAIEMVESLSWDDQTLLIALIHHRLAQQRRAEVVAEVAAARADYQRGQVLNAAEQRHFTAELDTEAAPGREGASWKGQGFTQGFQQGLAQGRQREAALLLRLLARRVGAVPSELAERVRALPLVELEAFAVALLDFSALNEAEAWLGQG